MTAKGAVVVLCRDLDGKIRPVDLLLSETIGVSHEAVHALIGLLDAARELASKVELPSKMATARFLKALVDAEVDVRGLDRKDSERCWLAEINRRCDKCGWVGSSDDVNATDYEEGEVFERDLEEDEQTGWILGDGHEALNEMKRQLADVTSDRFSPEAG